MNRNIKTLTHLRLWILGALVLGLLAAVNLTGDVQEIREKAATGGPVLYFVPAEITVPINSSNLVYELYLDTKDYEVNGAVFELKFDTNVIKIRDVVVGDVMRLVNDHYVEGGKAYLSIAIADEDKPFVGVGRIASVVFDTLSTPTTTYFTFEPNTQIHTKSLSSNILDKAIDGIIHIQISATPTIAQCQSCDTQYGSINTCKFPDPITGYVSYGRCNSGMRLATCGGRTYCCDGYWTDDLSYCGGGSLTPVPTIDPNAYCNDSDGQFNVFVKGTVTTDKGEFVDYCQDSNTVVEYYCISDPSPRSDNLPQNCNVLNNICHDGVCVSAASLTPTTQPTTTPIPTPCNKPGDANGDCLVNGLDFVIWLSHFATYTSNGPVDGDFNNDGYVDGLDYAIWYIFS